MAFYYNKQTGDFEGIPTVRQDSESLTLVTKHFSLFTIFAIQKEKLLHLNIDTKFTRGKDDWNLVNAGSYMELGGYCRGMCLSAIWYYTMEKPFTGEALWAQNDNGLGKGKETPYFWKDDRWAIRLCSAIQVNSTNMTKQFVDDFIQKEYHIDAARTPNRENFYCLAFSMYLSQKLHEEDPTRVISPQVIGIYHKSSSAETTGHVVICHKLKDNIIHVYDPNMPGAENPYTPTITYNDKDGREDGSFSKYSSAQNATDILTGNFIIYNHVRFRGVSSFDDMQEIDDMWTTAENGRCITDNASEQCFPEYTFYLVSKGSAGKSIETELDPGNGATVYEDKLSIVIKSPFKEARTDIYDFKEVEAYEKAKGKNPESSDIKFPSPVRLSDYRLNEGDNLLGFCVMAVTGQYENSNDQTVKEWSWAGFDWINIKYEPRETQEVEIDLSKFAACSIRLENINARMRLPGGKEDTATISPTESNTGSCWGEGSFSGNMFTTTWQERSCGSSCTCTGSISITIDPATMNIMDFSVNMNTDDRWQPDWVINMESKPGSFIETDLESFQKYDSSKLTYRVVSSKVYDYINTDSFEYKWTPGGDQWRECVSFDCTEDTVLTITLAGSE